MFCIPGPQAEKDHIFIIAGTLLKHWRSYMSVERLNNVINIYANVSNRSSLQNNSVQPDEGAIGDTQNIVTFRTVRYQLGCDFHRKPS